MSDKPCNVVLGRGLRCVRWPHPMDGSDHVDDYGVPHPVRTPTKTIAYYKPEDVEIIKDPKGNTLAYRVKT